MSFNLYSTWRNGNLCRHWNRPRVVMSEHTSHQTSINDASTTTDTRSNFFDARKIRISPCNTLDPLYPGTLTNPRRSQATINIMEIRIMIRTWTFQTTRLKLYPDILHLHMAPLIISIHQETDLRTVRHYWKPAGVPSFFCSLHSLSFSLLTAGTKSTVAGNALPRGDRLRGPSLNLRETLVGCHVTVSKANLCPSLYSGIRWQFQDSSRSERQKLDTFSCCFQRKF